ncbi:D-xylose 1-dehydrogenase (NADP(+)) [Paramyrothecium foliicola]|nr:D-xylose 1-dehydrogenase (NADP(+)) [Paramyrothecium foliicola]
MQHKMTEAREIRWGILATGAISITFAKDLLVDPKTREVTNIKHTIAAAASSSSSSRAQTFLKDVGAPSAAKAYGSYEELVQDPNVEIIYVATPHSHHYQNVRLCLEAGKHVLCEKAFTVNAKQARILAEKAKEKNLLLMEAFWTRYFPLTTYVRDVITSGKIGTVYRVFSDASARLNPESNFSDGKHRMVNADLAGGALLDLGVYSLTWPFLVFWQTQTKKNPPKVVSSITKYDKTSADESTTILLTFPREASEGGDAHAIATTSIRIGSVNNDPKPQPCVRIQGELGELQLYKLAQCPNSTRIVFNDGSVEEKSWTQPGPGKGSGWFNGFLTFMNPEGEGQGMFWEADEAAYALVEGRTEGKQMDLGETIAVMDVMDEVRRQGGLAYPEKIETVNYPETI